MKKLRGPTTASAKGYDFGTPIRYLHLPDGEWVKTITDATVVGCSYGYEYVPLLRTYVPSLALVARDEAKIRSAFQTFYSWTEGSDDDAVDVSIVFLKSGAYLLSISPEKDRQRVRNPRPVILDRLDMIQSWIKTMDTTGDELRKVSEYHRAFIAPISFGAGHLPPGPLTKLKPIDVRPIEGLRSLIKFRVNFAAEDDPDMPMEARIALQVHRQRREGQQSGPNGDGPHETPEEWRAKRTDVLREMFPVALFRARVSGLLERSAKEMGRTKVDSWQIEQAVCNLVMSERLKSGSVHYEGIPAEKLSERLVQVASAAGEVADGNPGLGKLLPTQVAKQVWLDADYLVRTLGEKPRDGSLGARQSILRHRGYLAPV